MNKPGFVFKVLPALLIAFLALAAAASASPHKPHKLPVRDCASGNGYAFTSIGVICSKARTVVDAAMDKSECAGVFACQETVIVDPWTCEGRFHGQRPGESFTCIYGKRQIHFADGY